MAKKQMTKAEFRRYLEKSGVVDVLEEIMAGLLAQSTKPKTALEFLQENEGLFAAMAEERQRR